MDKYVELLRLLGFDNVKHKRMIETIEALTEDGFSQECRLCGQHNDFFLDTDDIYDVVCEILTEYLYLKEIYDHTQRGINTSKQTSENQS